MDMTEQATPELFLREGGIPRHSHPRFVNTPVQRDVNHKGAPVALIAYDCGRCGNTGRYPSSMYEGVCLLCKGRAHLTKWQKLYTREQLDKMNATRDKKRAKKDAERVAAAEAKAAAVEARREEFMAANGAWIEAARAAAGHVEFVADILARAVNNAALSEKQVDAVNAAVARENEKRAYAAQAVHLGAVGDKVAVEGEVLYGSGMKNRFGWSYFYIIKTARGVVKFKGSTGLGKRGDVVRFDATVKKLETSDRDGSPVTVVARPRKFEYVSRAPERD